MLVFGVWKYVIDSYVMFKFQFLDLNFISFKFQPQVWVG